MVKFSLSSSFKKSIRDPPPNAFPTHLPFQGELPPDANRSDWVYFCILPQFLLIHPSVSATIPLGSESPEQHLDLTQFLPNQAPPNLTRGRVKTELPEPEFPKGTVSTHQDVPGSSRAGALTQEEPSASREVPPFSKPPSRANPKQLRGIRTPIPVPIPCPGCPRQRCWI